MSDLISRQAAIDVLDGVKVDEEDCTEYDIGYNDGIDFAVSKLSVLPSIDAVEVVRCKDCVNCQVDTIFNQYWCGGERVLPNGFCNYGRRKNE